MVNTKNKVASQLSTIKSVTCLILKKEKIWLNEHMRLEKTESIAQKQINKINNFLNTKALGYNN